MYLDEAVVEEHANEAGADAGVLPDGGTDDTLDDGLGGRALVVVVPHLEPARSRTRRTVVTSSCLACRRPAPRSKNAHESSAATLLAIALALATV